MGRKIPAKKHRGVKDPLVQQARRLQSLKGKINAPPRDPDEQPVPKSLTRLFAPLTRKPRGPRAARGPAGGAGGAGAGGAGVARLRRLPGEDARSFSRRITTAVRALHEADDAQHYPREEEEEEEPSSRRRRRTRAADAPQRPTRAQRRRLRQRHAALAAAQARLADARGGLVYERVAFGDTAPAPPALRPPRLPRAAAAAAAALAAPRPGRRELLLTPLLAGAGAGAAGAGAGAAAAGAGAAEQRRLAAVAAYRALKAARIKEAVPSR